MKLHTNLKHFLLGIIFVGCLSYWAFLALGSRIIIDGDIPGYIQLASVLKTNGLEGYLKTGPNREPIYPYLISLCMRLEEPLQRPFPFLVVYTQIIFLFLAQILTYVLLKKLRIHDYVTLAVVSYIGISPAIIHSTFTLYSEILIFPVVPLLFLFSYKFLESLKRPEWRSLFICIFMISICFVFLVFVKAVFEIVVPLFMSFLFILGYQLLSQKTVRYFFLVLLFLMTFYTPVLAYKALNQKYNGQFVLTDRGAWALYGQTARRMEPIDGRRLSAAFVFSSGWRNCLKIFTEKECQDWSFIPSDEIGARKRNELQKELLPRETNNKLLKLSFEKIMENPYQYSTILAIEGLKMFFWETTLVQYVYFPQIVFSIYNLAPVFFLFNYIVPIITLVSFIYALMFLWKSRKNEEDMRRDFVLLMIIFITIYVGVHSFFYILPRYILPISPLLLILVALFIERLLKR